MNSSIHFVVNVIVFVVSVDSLSRSFSLAILSDQPVSHSIIQSINQSASQLTHKDPHGTQLAGELSALESPLGWLTSLGLNEELESDH